MVEAMEIQNGYKQTEVGIIPNDWKVNKIDDFAIKVGSGITPTGGERVYKKEGRPFLRSQNVGWGNLILDDIAFIDDNTHNAFNSTEIQENDVFLNITGASIGRSAIADKRIVGGNVNQHVCIIRGDINKIESRYLNYFLLSYLGQKQINDFQAGGNRQGLNFGQIKSIQILLPPTKTEQTAIAAALNDADALITQLEKLIAKKRNIKQGAMQELLKPKDGWEIKKLGKVAKFRRGSFPQPYGLPKWYDDENGMPFVQVYDVDFNMKLKERTKQKISNAAKGKSVFVEKGSVVITIQGSIGRIAMTQYDSYVDRTLLIFKNFLIPMDKKFFMYVVYQLFQIEKQKAPGGTIKTITKEKLSDFNIEFPALKEQNKIAKILSDMDTEIEAMEKKLEKYKMIKQGMMQNLLTGKIRLV